MGRNGILTGMAPPFATLCADDIDASFESLHDVLRVTNHVHYRYLGVMELFDNVSRRDSNGADKELGARFDDDVDELVQLAAGIIFICLRKKLR
jgi:hypothetical protein